MKLFSLSLILIFVTNASFLYAASPIRDIDGDEVIAGVEYYVTRPIGFHGGLGLSRLRCSDAEVIEVRSETNLGLPITLSLIHRQDMRIWPNTTDVSVKFGNRCGYWTVREKDSDGRYFIGVNNMPLLPNSVFRVMQTGQAPVYTFATALTNVDPEWLEFGIVSGRDLNRLAVSEQENLDPYQFVFMKKESSNIQLPK